jgi:peroxiredoxin
MSRWLIAAGVYNLAWGALTVLYPAWLFRLTGLAEPNYPFIWQCVGMIVGVYGIGYLAAARDPARHWPIVLVGFLGKIFGPLGYASGVVRGDVPPEFGWTLLTNDLIWWVPFAMMLYHAFRVNTDKAPGDIPDVPTALDESRTGAGASIADLSRVGPVLVVLLRHTGCTFCREAIADLARVIDRIEAAGVRPVLVHQGADEDLQPLLARHGLERIDRVSDPDKRLYRALELRRGSFAQLFGPSVWIAGFKATLRGHLVGKLVGDGFQMPGVFLIRDGRVVSAHRHRTVAERPDYAGLCAVGPAA